tara:strand:- start:250 stop:1452 length:1203 start_codon:yes stop_codon:yes gene_type:complete
MCSELVDLSDEYMLHAADINDWLLRKAINEPDPARIFDDFCQRLVNAGVPIERAMYSAETLHAEQSGYGRVWKPGGPSVYIAFLYGSRTDELYIQSPFAWVHENRQSLSLCLAQTPDDQFGIIRDFKQEGFTHYICLPMFFSNGVQNGLSFATKDAGGLTPMHLALIEELLPAFRAVAEVKSASQRLHSALATYVGSEPSRMILEGDIHRGGVKRFRSAIMFVDMRNFTKLSTEISEEKLVEVLNEYYDCVVPHVEAAGGEVLKFIGDGVLAVFRAGPGQGPDACSRVLGAVKKVLKAIDQHNIEREKGGERPINAGVALHFGNPAYGNVGSGTRLDFTVIGRDVNYTSRIADMCSSFDCRLLMSEEFVKRLPDTAYKKYRTVSLPGVPGETTLFVPCVR